MTPFNSDWQPATFRERGVAVPFTTPALTGARLRLTERRCDLVAPHPAGLRGVYIFALPALSDFCTPSLHDLRLATLLEEERPLSPRAMRQVARRVAAEGAAGRMAAAAAAEAAGHEAQLCQAWCAFLLGGLKRAGQSPKAAPGDLRRDQAVLQLAGSDGRDEDAVRASLLHLARVLAGNGLACAAAAGARQPALIERMESLAAEMGASQDGGAFVACGVGAFASAARALLHALGPLLADPGSLLASWANRPELLEAELGRPAWLLDGWDHLCLAWQLAANTAERAAALREIASLMPPVPPEALGWFEGAGALQHKLATYQASRQHGGRGKSTVPADPICLIARNERIRAMAA